MFRFVQVTLFFSAFLFSDHWGLWARSLNRDLRSKAQVLQSHDESWRNTGLSRVEWHQILDEHDRFLHSIHLDPKRRAWSRSRTNHWKLFFDHSGFKLVPDSDTWTLGMTLLNYGRSGTMVDTRLSPEYRGVRIELNTLQITYKDITQWFQHKANGLEQGFTISRRPSGNLEGDLRVVLQVTGLKPRNKGEALEFVDNQSVPRLGYSHLAATDARGMPLRASMKATKLGQVEIVVNDANAVYPLTIDPLVHQLYLKASPFGTYQYMDRFGYSVATTSDTVAIGAPGEDSSTTGINSAPNEDAYDSGAVFIYIKTITGWRHQAYIKPTRIGSSQIGNYFGFSVSINSNTLLVGAPFARGDNMGINSQPNGRSQNSGAAYLYTRSGQSWTETTYFKPSLVGLTQENDSFGFAVSIRGDGRRLVIGAPGEDSSSTGVDSTPNEDAENSGAAYTFSLSLQGVWFQDGYLKPAQVGVSQAMDVFGASVAFSGATVAIGAPGEDGGGLGVNSLPDERAFGAGAVYLFDGASTPWRQIAYLKPQAVGGSQQYDGLGMSVALTSTRIIAGAPFEDSASVGVNSQPDELALDSGAAYVWRLASNNTWTQEAYLKPSAYGSTQAGDYFGLSVGISGLWCVVGAPFEDGSGAETFGSPNDGSSDNRGAAYLFRRDNNLWQQVAYLKPTFLQRSESQFGNAIAISGETLVIGAVGDPEPTPAPSSVAGSQTGSANIFINTPI
jgi:hypothetical protein